MQTHDSFAQAPPFNVRRSDMDLDGISEEPGSSDSSGASGGRGGGKGGLRQRRKEDAAPQPQPHAHQHGSVNKAQSLAGKRSFLDYFILRAPPPVPPSRATVPPRIHHLGYAELYSTATNPNTPHSAADNNAAHPRWLHGAVAVLCYHIGFISTGSRVARTTLSRRCARNGCPRRARPPVRRSPSPCMTQHAAPPSMRCWREFRSANGRPVAAVRTGPTRTFEAVPARSRSRVVHYDRADATTRWQH